MRLPDLLATRRGRLAAFFLLYVTEGIPSGFSTVAVAATMRRQGLEPAAIGAFVGALYLPWALKWALGPFVDVLSSDRWGRRRLWILITQTMMAVTLLIAMPVDITASLGLFTALLLIHNVFAATQDVAIDALAVNTLRTEERGLANGLMFGGQSLGIALGGSGVLLLTPWIGFKTSFLLVAGVIALVTLLVRDAAGSLSDEGASGPAPGGTSRLARGGGGSRVAAVREGHGESVHRKPLRLRRDLPGAASHGCLLPRIGAAVQRGRRAGTR
jgi:PAT family beta-lactamase induction signal transducer AmpG